MRDLKLLCRDQPVNQSKSSSVLSEPHTSWSFVQAIAHDAFKALVNLTDSPIVISALSDTVFLQFLVSYALVGTDFSGSRGFSPKRLILVSQNPQATLADLAAMLLSNLSVSAAVTSALLSMKISIIPDRNDPGGFYPVRSKSETSPLPPSGDPQDVLAMPLLVDAFVQSALVDENQKFDHRKRKGELHFLASVFANITTVGSIDHTSKSLSLTVA